MTANIFKVLASDIPMWPFVIYSSQSPYNEFSEYIVAGGFVTQ